MRMLVGLACVVGCATSPTTVITEVAIVDVVRGQTTGPQTLVIRDGRIVEIGATVQIPDGAERLDGRGRFVIPGLTDMHVHLFNRDRPPNTWAFALLVANGVTAVREMAAPLAGLARVNQWRAAGGPRIVAAGVPIRAGAPVAAQVDAAADAGADFIKVFSELPAARWREVLEAARRRGLPVIGHVPAGVALLDAARAGQRGDEHLMQAFEACTASEATWLAGRAELAGDALAARRDADEPAVLDAFDPAACARVAQALAALGQVQDPTLVLAVVEAQPETASESAPAPASDPRVASAPASESRAASAPASDPRVASAPASDPRVASPPASDPRAASAPASDPRVASAPASDPRAASPPASDPRAASAPASDPRVARQLASDPRWRYLSAGERARWIRLLAAQPAADRAIAARRWGVARQIVAAFARAGVPIVAGTDAPMPRVYPGFALHDELEALVRAGLTPADALRAATETPARVLGLPDTGTIAIGQRADLVILDADPLRDIRNTRKIHAVVLAGRLLRRAALDAALQSLLEVDPGDRGGRASPAAGDQRARPPGTGAPAP